jgi:hypothetical protein
MSQCAPLPGHPRESERMERVKKMDEGKLHNCHDCRWMVRQNPTEKAVCTCPRHVSMTRTPLRWTDERWDRMQCVGFEWHHKWRERPQGVDEDTWKRSVERIARSR